MDYDIFVSYAHQDKAFVDALVHSLEASQIRCWYAPRDIPTGMEWPAAIPPAIKQSRLMLLVFSKDSNVSQEVAKELTIASNHKKLVVPVNLDRTPLNEQMEYHLSNKHWLDVYDLEIESAIQRVQYSLKDYQHMFKEEHSLDAATPPHTAQKPLAEQKPMTVQKADKVFDKNTLLKYGFMGCVALLVVGALLWAFSGSKDETQSATSAQISSHNSAPKTENLSAEFAKAQRHMDAQDYEDALEILEKLVKKSHAQAEMLLGDMYYSGLGVQMDRAKATALYQRAANQGLMEAQYSLAYMYEQGESVTKDVNKALELYNKAANAGHGDAMYSLGEIYELGSYVSADKAQAFAYFLKAAKIGLVPAQYKVGMFYYMGTGTEKNQAEGLNWLYKAADAGDSLASEFLKTHK